MTSRNESSARGWPLATLLAVAACNPARGTTRVPEAPAGAPRAPGLSAAAEVGRRIFFDKSLSASGQMSCATCHDPDHAYGPPSGLPVQLGGPQMDEPGLRAVPSLRYKEATPAYADLLDNPDGVSAPGPGGGYAWDGRADTLADQAKLPLLSPVEMANASPAEVARKIEAAPYAAQLAQAFGDVRGEADVVFESALRALEAFQKEDPSFHPYTSKFDLHAGNKIGGSWTPAEARGGLVFASPKLGNCASCHYPGAGLNGSSGMFTDYSYEAIGVPRNAQLASNKDSKLTDLGLCGPLRTDHAAGSQPNRFCGMFKTPSLRNVTQRKVFFHNGVIHSLEQAIRFYNTRDTMPELWYPTVGGRARPKPDHDFPSYGLVTTQYVGGRVDKYDDLPEAYRRNIDPQMPLDGRRAGSKPPLSAHQIADLICFLETLTDGYQVPATPPVSGRCVN